MGPRDNSLPDEGNLLTELQHFQGFCGRLPWGKTIVDINPHVLCLSLVCTVKEGLRPDSTNLDRGFGNGWKVHADRDSLQAARHAGGHQDVTSK